MNVNQFSLGATKFGFLLLHKDPGPTSHDLIAQLRRITGIKKIGHAGTLDPFASGLLIVGIGRENTKDLGQFIGLAKTYEAIFLLGAKSTTDDRMGEIYPCDPSASFPNEQMIQSTIQSFIGPTEQIPPQYAAIKIQGKKMYELARLGKIVDAKPRHVTIFSFNLHAVEYLNKPNRLIRLKTTISCSSGTYIRSIARDLGEKLGINGYVQELCRTSIGPFLLSESIHLSELQPENWQNYLLPKERLINRLI